MNATQVVRPSRPPSATEPWTDARRNARPSASDPPTFGELLGKTLQLIGVVVVAGPPVVLLAGPLLLLALVLIGPFALLFTLVVLFVVALVLVALTGALLAMPFLLVSHLREHRAVHASISAPAGQPVSVESRRAIA